MECSARSGKIVHGSRRLLAASFNWPEPAWSIKGGCGPGELSHGWAAREAAAPKTSVTMVRVVLFILLASLLVSLGEAQEPAKTCKYKNEGKEYQVKTMILTLWLTPTSTPSGEGRWSDRDQEDQDPRLRERQDCPEEESGSALSLQVWLWGWVERKVSWIAWGAV